MILLAVFSLIGGERLARREVEERTPIEKEKVLAFSKAFTKEVERIDELYLSHIEALAKGYTSHNDDETLANAREALEIIDQKVNSFEKERAEINKVFKGFDLRSVYGSQTNDEKESLGIQSKHNSGHNAILIIYSHYPQDLHVSFINEIVLGLFIRHHLDVCRLKLKYLA